MNGITPGFWYRERDVYDVAENIQFPEEAARKVFLLRFT